MSDDKTRPPGYTRFEDSFGWIAAEGYRPTGKVGMPEPASADPEVKARIDALVAERERSHLEREVVDAALRWRVSALLRASTRMERYEQLEQAVDALLEHERESRDREVYDG